MAYNDDADKTLKVIVHMMAALAFVPLQDVASAFDLIRSYAAQNAPTLEPIRKYFEETFVIGYWKKARSFSSLLSCPVEPIRGCA